MDKQTLSRYADLIVGFGANVQPGQIVVVGCEPGTEYMTRAIAESAYQHGAKFVDVGWFDPMVKRARAEFADEDTLEFVPSWYSERMLAIGDQHCALIGLAAASEPGLMDGLDPARVGKDRLPFLKETMGVINAGTLNWTVAPCPTTTWAQILFPELDKEIALRELENLIFKVCRLDQEDPIAAWNRRLDLLIEKRKQLTEYHFDAVHLFGPGTDLTVGLLPSSRWAGGGRENIDGVRHIANLPTEEVFATPDPQRAEGHVTATMPLVLADGTVVEGLHVQFENGQATRIEADRGGEVLDSLAHGDTTGTRLGEIALVDRESQIGKLDRVFYTTLLDENAACHIALGAGYALVEDKADEPKVNKSGIHIDFMVGSNEVSVDGIARTGENIPLLRDGDWQI
jgi:aminopeptidase